MLMQSALCFYYVLDKSFGSGVTPAGAGAAGATSPVPGRQRGAEPALLQVRVLLRVRALFRVRTLLRVRALLRCARSYGYARFYGYALSSGCACSYRYARSSGCAHLGCSPSCCAQCPPAPFLQLHKSSGKQGLSSPPFYKESI